MPTKPSIVYDLWVCLPWIKLNAHLAWCVNNVVAAFNQEKAPVGPLRNYEPSFGPSCGPSSTSSHRVAVEGAGAGCAGVAPGAAQRGAAQLAGAHHPL